MILAASVLVSIPLWLIALEEYMEVTKDLEEI